MSVISSDSRRPLKTLAVVGGKQQVQQEALRLTRSLGSLETWSFGLTGHISWIGTAPVIHAALGSGAIFVWLPGVIVAVLLDLQVQRLGMCWPDMAGGTPNYAARLLNNFPGLARYVALGYFLGWASFPVVNAIILTDLIKANLDPLGISCPETLLKIGFTCIAFIVAFSGTRALGILHSFFVIPAMGLLLVFCIQGIGWLALSPASPGLFPTHWSSPSFGEWAKWFFIATYCVYTGETASSFVADSLRPSETLRVFSLAALLIPPVFIGGSWVLMQLATQPGLGDNLYLNLLAAAQPFWGQSASFFVTLLIAFGCLLSCATTVGNTSRILYQLALDGHLSPVFAVVSRRGVLEPALIFTFLVSLLCLLWGNLSHVVMVTGTSYLVSFMGFHLGLWLRRGYSEVRWPWLSLCFFIMEAVVLVVGGLAWSWQDLLIGLLLPLTILAVDTGMRRIAFAPFHRQWWLQRYYARTDGKIQDFVMFEVIVLIVLICGAVTIGWVISAEINRTSSERSGDFLGILLITLSFVGVAIACWTTLPQIAGIDEARQQAKNLFITTLDTVPDTVLVLDENGTIRQTNAAAEELFQMNTQDLVGHNLNGLFSALFGTPEQWPSRSEQTLEGNQSLRIIELTISQQSNQKLQEYVVLLRDITERKRAEETLQLFADIASSRARDSQDLEPVFNKAVTAARESLKADRVVVYRFYPNWSGYIAAESVVPGWSQAQANKIGDTCIPEHLIEAYRKGRVVPTNNVKQTSYSLEHMKLLERLEIKASLVTPILQNDQLFGLLIAHHCSYPHAWQQSEINFLSQLAAQLGFIVDRVTFLEQQSTAKEQLQKRAIELLMEVDPISKGDLTIRASVTDDEIGTVADSYNATVASLRQIVTQVQAAAKLVATTTNSSEGSVQELSKEALRQAQEIAAALDRIQEMSNSIRAVAANAQQAEAAVLQATQTVEAGDAAMNRTVDGILAIRETVAETSTKVKRLGESSQKISKVVKLISTFADQTNLLALNAAIEAARAGEEGRGFAVIADEVQSLALQSAEASAEIESLVTDIQTETNSVVAAMEAGTQQVVTGTKLVDETRQSLNKITAVSAQISALVEAIASAAVAQSQASESVTQTMTDVAAIASITSTEATQVSASFKKLLAVATELQASAGQFKVS